jgi:hypothetical protein
MTKLEELKLLAFELDNLDKVVPTHEVSKIIKYNLENLGEWEEGRSDKDLNNIIRHLCYEVALEAPDNEVFGAIRAFVTHSVYEYNRILNRGVTSVIRELNKSTFKEKFSSKILELSEYLDYIDIKGGELVELGCKMQLASPEYVESMRPMFKDINDIIERIKEYKKEKEEEERQREQLELI